MREIALYRFEGNGNSGYKRSFGCRAVSFGLYFLLFPYGRGELALIGLWNRRAEYAVEIGKIKKCQGLPVLDASREQEILSRVAQKAEVQKGPLSPESMRRIFQVIMAETRQVEK